MNFQEPNEESENCVFVSEPDERTFECSRCGIETSMELLAYSSPDVKLCEHCLHSIEK